ncbi:hypothetical protein F2Q69_00055371 [Brassica cretica]|uniref:F-box domain-containing protein n=1 Tax=Brassica cretica TaxID=69181 RepID=A0A8S9MZP5_BRACR|nr:hypothetical protein F2Q69_00055371 [Brassica cretica]
MSLSDDEDEYFARFLESEVSSVEDEEKTKEPEPKRQRLNKDKTKAVEKDGDQKEDGSNKDRNVVKRIEGGFCDLFLDNLDLSCSLVCKFLNFAASDESLWRRLYCIRWGLMPSTRMLRECAWKKLYIDRDEKDMIELVRSCPTDFKEYYIQMQAAKRSQAPLAAQMVDDQIVLDKTVLDKVSMWKKSKGLPDKAVVGHVCLGTKCDYHQIDDVFICQETGNYVMTTARKYCIRWGLMPSTRMLRECAWKKLYIDRDEKDMIELVRSCPTDFKEYYIQMQAAKRSQAPLAAQMVDDQIVLDKTVLDKVSMWKKSKGLPDKAVVGHVCLGTKCDYHQIDDVFICQETGNVHVCDDNCKEVIFCRESGNMVCTISGLCSESLLVQDDSDADEEEAEQEAEVLTGRGRFGRAFEFGYNCESEQELDRSFGFC